MLDRPNNTQKYIKFMFFELTTDAVYLVSAQKRGEILQNGSGSHLHSHFRRRGYRDMPSTIDPLTWLRWCFGPGNKTFLGCYAHKSHEINNLKTSVTKVTKLGPFSANYLHARDFSEGLRKIALVLLPIQ